MSPSIIEKVDYIDIHQYLSILCDPLDGGRLELLDKGDSLELRGSTSGLHYPFQGGFPDLRPDAGYFPNTGHQPSPRIDAKTTAVHRRVQDHYEQEPCNDYLALDNLPLGKYLRDPQYAPYFENVKLAIEVGSGKGAIAQVFKQYRGITPLCIDLAYGSLRHVRDQPLSADGLLASNLSLPIADAVADLVISYGVIHHTPNPLLALRELVRILKPGGRLLLGVYNWENLYRSLYFCFSPPFKAVRQVLGPRWGNLILQLTVFLPYHLSLWLVLGLVQGRWQFPELKESWEQFGDFFLTPIAYFYHAGELVTMGEVLGLKVLEQDTGGWPHNSFSHFVWYQKL